MPQRIYGNEVGLKRKENLKAQLETLKQEGKRMPTLAVVLIGEDPASKVYVKGKEKACAFVGITSRVYHLKEDICQEEVLALIDDLNNDQEVDGILVQLPLPKGLDEKEILHHISYEKDVDGLHPYNVGRLYLNEEGFVPCTPLGIMKLLESIDYPLQGKHAVVIGRSKLVGSPVARLLQNENATVTICHSKTEDLRSFTKQADVLVVAMGQPKMIDSSYIKEGAVVIDVGMHRLEDGSLCGDVDFDSVFEHTSYMTPVPKGVGPMTITMLLENTFQAYRKREGL